jgi:Tol biopolymer transport system component
MAVALGTRLGPYEIVAPLGAGGMGEVYRAADTRLNRTVAIKVLPAEVADHPDRRQRFEREARAVSSLTHPHICALYDVGREHDVEFLVMEFVEGDTLDRRLVDGPLPLPLTIRYAIDIADALDHAHRRGIVHRDLKPANIMLTRAGVKLLDFGLAKARTDGGVLTLSSLAARPTKTLTGEGTILGTLQYMAPEQLEGRPVDARTDLFAFGAVLYEMLAGRRAFDGESQASVIAAILRAEPPAPRTLQPLTPAALDRLVRKCLAKDPDDRWQTARDVMSELEWIGQTAATASRIEAAPAGAVGGSWSRARIAWTVAALLLASLATTLGYVTIASRRASVASRPITFIVSPPEGAILPRGGPVPFAVSPDGRQLAFVASRAGTNHLWVRSLESVTLHELPDSDGAQFPFWSPDSRSLAFFTGGRLEKIVVAGGRPQILCECPGGPGDWNSDGIILFGAEGGLFQASAAGGPARPLTRLDPSAGEMSHDLPQFLPDGRHFLYVIRSQSTHPDRAGLYVGSLGSTARQRILPGTSNVVYTPPGYLLFWRNGGVLAQSFDPARLQLTGEAIPVADVAVSGLNRGSGMFAASPAGVFAYVSPTDRQLTWVDRTGRPLGSVGAPGRDRNPALSPDDRRVAVERLDPGTTTIGEIWVIDVASGAASRLTPRRGALPIWSPDGSRVAFGAQQDGRYAVYQKLSNGEGNEELLVPARADALYTLPAGWSRDGRLVLFFTGQEGVAASQSSPEDRQRAPARLYKLWALPVAGDRKPIHVMDTEQYAGRAQLSPNGRWLAYTSAESGTDEVYVQSFPTGEGKRQISPAGGLEPRWRSDGRELFYLAPDQHMMAIPVSADMPPRLGSPVPLFETRIILSTGAIAGRQYVVTADGQRFLINQPPTGPLSTSITVAINWLAGLRQ